jgi:hypothetical protein
MVVADLLPRVGVGARVAVVGVAVVVDVREVARRLARGG